jgi:tetratricopeptide (TPR) repeat protein
MVRRTTFALLLLTAALVWPQSSSATGQNSSAHNAPALTPDQKEAQTHYKIAVLAVDNGDFDIALKELAQASQLDPNNAVIWYNLAIVQSKKGKNSEALSSIEQALKLGVPEELKVAAEDFKVKVAYEHEKQESRPKPDEENLQSKTRPGTPTIEQTLEYLNKIADSDPMPTTDLDEDAISSFNGKFFVDRKMIWWSHMIHSGGSNMVVFCGNKISDPQSSVVSGNDHTFRTRSGARRSAMIVVKCPRCWQRWYVPRVQDFQAAKSYLSSTVRKPDNASAFTDRDTRDVDLITVKIPDDDREAVVARFERAWKHLIELVESVPSAPPDPNDPFAK